MPCCIPARDSARCPCVPRELTIKARARLPVAHPLAHHTTRQPHAHGGSSPAPYQGKTGADGMGATSTCARRHQLFPAVCFVRAVWQALVHPLDCENSIPAQGTQPLHCRSRTAVDGKYFASKMFKTGCRSIHVTHTCCMQASAPAPSAMLTGKVSSMQTHSGFRLQHCIGGERVPLDRLLSVVAAHAECLRHWQSFFHQPSQPFLFCQPSFGASLEQWPSICISVRCL